MQDSATVTMRVALYVRVSSEEQREGQTIDSQVSELDRFARDKGWAIIGVYKDDGWSGALLARPGLDRLRDDASKGRFDAALVNDVDRLARDVSQLGIVKREFEKLGINLIFKKLPNESSPTHNLMVNILGSFAEFERELILDRTRRGRRHKVEVRQEYLGSNAPYGYHYSPRDRIAGKGGSLDLVPEEAAVVREMFHWVDSEGLSARQVTLRLNRMKIRPRRGGKTWGKSSVLRMLRSETYAGVWHYNKYEACEPRKPLQGKRYRHSAKGSLRRRPKSEWIPVVLPEALRIVDRDRWQRVQDQLERNIAFSSRNSRHRYLLSGLVQCGGCGARYCGDPNHGRFYYRCYARCKTYPSIRDDVLNEIVWGAVAEAVNNPTLIADQVARREKRKAELHQTHRGQAAELEIALAAIDQEESQILKAYRLHILSPEQLTRELDQLKARRSVVDARLVAIKGESTAPSEATSETIFESCERLARELESFTFEERQRFLQLLVDQVVVEGDKIIIKGVLPVSWTMKPNREPATNKNSPMVPAAAPIFSDDRIATTESYTPSHNSVSEVGFEFTKILPEEVPLKDRLTPEFLRRLLQHNPSATLAEFRDELKLKYSIVASITALYRAFKRAGLGYRTRNELNTDLRKAA